MTKEIIKENPLGSMPINKLIASMAFPLMLSMLIQALYNVVDSIFVSRISEDALTAVSLVFPVQNLMIAVAVGTSIGMNAIMSRRLGEKNNKQANATAHNGIILAIISSAAFALFGIFGSSAFMRLSSNNEWVIENGTNYMAICLVFSLGVYMQITMERILQATGKTVYQMAAQITGAVINIILDPIFIFGLLGAPEMGVAGAAVATVVGQWCGMLVGIALNIKYNNEIRLSIKKLKLKLNIVIEIYKIAFPSIVMQSVGSVLIFFFNQILNGFTQTAVAVFGIYFKLFSFVVMPLFGVVSSLVPIVGYNYGAKNKKRIIEAVKSSLVIGCLIMFTGMLIFLIFPSQLLLMFDASDEMLEIGTIALRVLCLCFVPATFAITLSSVFQALGHGMLSLWMSIARQLFVLLPSAFILSSLFGLHAIWFSFLFAEVISVFLAFLFFSRVYKNKIVTLDDTSLEQ